MQGSDATNSDVSPFDGDILCPSNDPDQSSKGPTAWHNPDVTPEPSTLAGGHSDPHPPGAKLMKSNLSLNIGALAKLITIILTYLLFLSECSLKENKS